jgi:hypothetical protein
VLHVGVSSGRIRACRRGCGSGCCCFHLAFGIGPSPGGCPVVGGAVWSTTDRQRRLENNLHRPVSSCRVLLWPTVPASPDRPIRRRAFEYFELWLCPLPLVRFALQPVWHVLCGDLHVRVLAPQQDCPGPGYTATAPSVETGAVEAVGVGRVEARLSSLRGRVWQPRQVRVAAVWRGLSRQRESPRKGRAPACTPLHGARRGVSREELAHSPLCTPSGADRGDWI